MNQNNNGFIVTLTCKNDELYRLNTNDFVEEISIGRDTTCTWSVGHADISVSNRHAIISRRKKDFYITDLGSRNGMFCDGVQVKELRLAPGMNIQFGSCVLSVFLPGNVQKTKQKPHLLKYFDNNGKLVKVRLFTGKTRIGGSEKYDIYLNSPLVSSPHATISGNNDGSFWIKDLNSRNGTSVNNTELIPKTERMLKHGDVISIADFDMTYYDPTAKTEGSRLLLTLIIIFVSIIVCGVAYWGYQQMKPSADELINQARIAAKNKEFKKARKLLVSASSAKNGKEKNNERRLLTNRINVWEHTASNWEALKAVISKNQFQKIPQFVGSLDLSSVASWDWNETTAVTKKSTAEYIKNLFSAMSIVDSNLKNTETNQEQLYASIVKLNKELNNFSKLNDDYLKGLKSYGKKILIYALHTKKQIELFEKRVQKWDTSPIDVSKEIASLEKIVKYSPPVLVSRVEKILPILYSIRKAEEQLVKQEKLIVSLKFSECRNEKIDFPKNNLSIKGFDKLIDYIKKQDLKYKEIAANLEVYYTILKWEGIDLGKPYLSLKDFTNPKILNAIFGCDSIKMPYPAKKRTKASGVYDQFVGIEYLYASLMMIKTYETVRSRYDIPFSPKLEKVSGEISIMTLIVKIVEKEIPNLAKQGYLKKYLTYLKNNLAKRDSVVVALQNKMKDNTKREYFIAHGIVFALNSSLYSYTKRDILFKEFLNYRATIQKLNSEYSNLLPAEAIKLREEILRKGIPGDPIVRRMWNLR